MRDETGARMEGMGNVFSGMVSREGQTSLAKGASVLITWRKLDIGHLKGLGTNCSLNITFLGYVHSSGSLRTRGRS